MFFVEQAHWHYEVRAGDWDAHWGHRSHQGGDAGARILNAPRHRTCAGHHPPCQPGAAHLPAQELHGADVSDVPGAAGVLGELQRGGPQGRVLPRPCWVPLHHRQPLPPGRPPPPRGRMPAWLAHRAPSDCRRGRVMLQPQLDEILQKFRDFKQSVPVMGAIMLDK